MTRNLRGSEVQRLNPVDEASEALANAIEAERRAVCARIDAEERLVALMPARDKGGVVLRGESYRASIRYAVTHTVDSSKIVDLERAIPPVLLNQVIAREPVVLPDGLRYLRDNEPVAYQTVARAISTRRTASVRVELLQDTLAVPA